MSDQDQQQQQAHEPMTAARLAAIRARADEQLARTLDKLTRAGLRKGRTLESMEELLAKARQHGVYPPALYRDTTDLLAFVEAALPILRAVATCEAVRSPTFGLGGIEGIVLHHDSLNVLWMREQARALLAGTSESEPTD